MAKRSLPQPVCYFSCTNCCSRLVGSALVRLEQVSQKKLQYGFQRSYIRQGRPLTRKESEASGNVSRKGSSRKALSCGSLSFLPWLKHRGGMKGNIVN